MESNKLQFELIGSQVSYDKDEQMIIAETAVHGRVCVCDVGLWEDIFANSSDRKTATETHDSLGEWIAEAINEKLNR